MYFGDRLDLDSAIFQALRDEIMVSINAALMLADKEGKEGEVSIKIKVSTVTGRNFKDGAVCKEWTEPRFSWTVTRKMKENKIDHKGSSVAGWELRFDEDGRPYVIEANQQASLFDAEESDGKTVIHYHFGEKKAPEVSEDADSKEDTDEGRNEGGEDEAEGNDANSEEIAEVSKETERAEAEEADAREE